MATCAPMMSGSVKPNTGRNDGRHDLREFEVKVYAIRFFKLSEKCTAFLDASTKDAT